MDPKIKKTLDGITTLTSKGRLKMALEKCIIFIGEFETTSEADELKDDAIFNLSKLVSLEEKHLNQIIGFEDFSMAESKILKSTLIVINELEELIENFSSSNRKKSTSKPGSLVGTWKSDHYFDVNSESNAYIIWIVGDDDKDESVVMNPDEDQRVYSSPRTKWELKNGIFYSYSEDLSEVSRSIIEWKGSDIIQYTWLEAFYNDKIDDKLAGTKLIFRRIG